MTLSTVAKYPDVFNKQDWNVEATSLYAAQKLVQKHHYSGGGSNTAVYVHGLYLRKTKEFCGVAWWLPPTRVACESVNREQWQRVLSLTRLVIVPGVPTNACSFLMAKSIKLIGREGRFCSLVTYADESQGHSGAIYKASNWTYAGRTGPYPRWLDPASGRQVAQKATVNRTKAEMLALGYVKQGSFHKHKFVLHLRPSRPSRKRVDSQQYSLLDLLGDVA